MGTKNKKGSDTILFALFYIIWLTLQQKNNSSDRMYGGNKKCDGSDESKWIEV